MRPPLYHHCALSPWPLRKMPLSPHVQLNSKLFEGGVCQLDFLISFSHLVCSCRLCVRVYAWLVLHFLFFPCSSLIDISAPFLWSTRTDMTIPKRVVSPVLFVRDACATPTVPFRFKRCCSTLEARPCSNQSYSLMEPWKSWPDMNRSAVLELQSALLLSWKHNCVDGV